MPKMPSLSIVVPGLPPSDNNAYPKGRNTNRRVLSSGAQRWKTSIGEAIRDQTTLAERKPFREGLYVVLIRFYFDLYGKSGAGMLKWDVSSHQKLTVDAVADMIYNDDANCVSLNAEKYQRLVGKIPQTQVDVLYRGPHQRG